MTAPTLPDVPAAAATAGYRFTPLPWPHGMTRAPIWPELCLLHEDVHPHHGEDCATFRACWIAEHRRQHGDRQAAQDAYALEVEQRILNDLIRAHAPARILNPALTAPRPTAPTK
ncbi:MAG: hypothetical protein HOY79_33605 [Streptomyces sp.]|nr:hypothetical protein [Streptomyces sp.]NUS11371.1 hypothetical protein [Streptomyces sp.]NUS23488.1 hypothetical protein [Streptomyces sp.]